MSLIKFFESTDAGAPTLNNAVGSMIAVLDACLITGYNTKAVTSITVASGVATVVCAAHGYANTYGKAIRIAGATGSFTALNKDTQIANVTTNGFTFLCPGVADGAATGTLTAKYAPLDWTKQYAGTNKAMYKRGDVTATSCMLRIDDNAVGQSCRALMVQSATDIDTYTNPAPVAAQIADGLGQYWSKGYNDATAADWFIVADHLYFYFFVKGGAAGNAYVSKGFGDIIDFKSTSVLGCEIAGPASSGSQLAYSFYGASVSSGVCVVSGGKNGISNSQNLVVESRIANYGITGSPYPSEVDGGLVIYDNALLKEGGDVNANIRGRQPGLAIPYAALESVFSNKQIISNIIGSPRQFIFVKCGSAPGAGASFSPLIDLTGPWR